MTVEVSMEKKKKSVELPEEYAVVSIPANAVELTLTAKVMLTGKLITVKKVLDTGAVRVAFREAEENYVPGDAVYCLTEKGKKLADDLKAEMNELWR